MTELSTKPYLIRAIHQWCTDAGFTPYVAVAVGPSVRVPMEHVKNGEIVLNVSGLATSRLKIGNDAIEFQARFSGVARDVYVPMDAVIAIYARENGQGMAFEVSRPVPVAGEGKPAAPTDAQPPQPLLRLAADAPTSTPEQPVPPDPEPDPNAPRPRLTRVK